MFLSRVEGDILPNILILDKKHRFIYLRVIDRVDIVWKWLTVLYRRKLFLNFSFSQTASLGSFRYFWVKNIDLQPNDILIFMHNVPYDPLLSKHFNWRIKNFKKGPNKLLKLWSDIQGFSLESAKDVKKSSIRTHLAKLSYGKINC